jgi:hypothetical protein
MDGTGGSSGGGASSSGGVSEGGASNGGASGRSGGSAGRDAGGSGERDASSGGHDSADAGVDGASSRTPGADGGDVLDAGEEAATPLGPNPLEFSFPPRHSVTVADAIRVSGIVGARTDVVSVTVNSVPAASLEGPFARWRTTTDVPLSNGDNTLTIVATLTDGRTFALTGDIVKLPPTTTPDQLVPSYDVATATSVSIARDIANEVWTILTPNALSTLRDSGIMTDAVGSIGADEFFISFAPNGELITAADYLGDALVQSPSVNLWDPQWTTGTPIRFAISPDGARGFAVQPAPVALVAFDATRQAPPSSPLPPPPPPDAIVISDATHGTGPALVPGSAIVVRDATHVYLPGCNGAIDVDLITGNRTSWGSPNDDSCVVAEGTFQGKAVALQHTPDDPDAGTSNAARWQVRLIDPAAQSVTPLFEFEPHAELQAAAIDAAGARIGVVTTNPFSFVTYDLPSGRATPLMPVPALVTNQFRDLAFNTYVTPSGKLLVSDDIVVSPDTGARKLVPFTSAEGNQGAEASDPDTGLLYLSTAAGVYRVDPETHEATRLGDAMGYVLAYDPPRHTLYGLDNTTTYVMNTLTGTVQSAPNSSDLMAVINCNPVIVRVSADGTHLNIASGGTSPGFIPRPPFTCGCEEYEVATGNVVSAPNQQSGFWGYCESVEVPDGRLVQFNGDELDVLDRTTAARTPFSQAPNIGRGMPLVNQGGNWSVTPDPRRDRWWLSVIPQDSVAETTNNYYFMIDPYNGDRVLVSE